MTIYFFCGLKPPRTLGQKLELFESCFVSLASLKCIHGGNLSVRGRIITPLIFLYIYMYITPVTGYKDRWIFFLGVILILHVIYGSKPGSTFVPEKRGVMVL